MEDVVGGFWATTRVPLYIDRAKNAGNTSFCCATLLLP